MPFLPSIGSVESYERQNERLAYRPLAWDRSFHNTGDISFVFKDFERMCGFAYHMTARKVYIHTATRAAFWRAAWLRRP